MRILTLSWRRKISYRNQSIDLQSKSMDWFLYDIGIRSKRINIIFPNSNATEADSNNENNVNSK